MLVKTLFFKNMTLLHSIGELAEVSRPSDSNKV